MRSFDLEITYQGVVYTTNINNYITTYDNNYAIFNIPKNVLTNSINLYSGNAISFDLIVNPDDNPNSSGTWSSYSLGTYTLNLTAQEQEQINDDSNKHLLGNIDNSIQQTNNSINNLNNTQQETNNKIDDLTDVQQETNDKIDNLQNTIADTNVPDYYSSYEEFAENYTGSFANLDQFQRIWQILYNAFYSDEITNLTVTIPFTNRQMTISSDIVANVPNEVKSIIALISYGFVVVFIMKDIRTIINTFSSGHIEKVGKDVKKGDL